MEEIKIPGPLYEKIAERVKGTEFESVEEYITFVLNEVITDQEEGPALTKEEEEKVKERLKGLGYL
ncbi:MAG: hypothetical protein V3R93_06495 [Candidatus Hydrothermarchaeaceae archaeon]